MNRAFRARSRPPRTRTSLGWVAAFTEDGTFTHESIEVVYRGPDELAFTVENHGRAFPDRRRELYQMYSISDIVVVQLGLQGTHLGPLQLPVGTTGGSSASTVISPAQSSSPSSVCSRT